MTTGRRVLPPPRGVGIPRPIPLGAADVFALLLSALLMGISAFWPTRGR